ncbi:SIMPL domain-containing protein [Pelobium sp.]|nr:SIMPL domain-containing protein [Pelobium sp.]MDA9555515.1 SIMPL domain-containing protein [Pelobium sp.]
MKKIILSSLIALATLSTFAQNIDTRKKIEVTGTSEIEVTPDEIYVGFSLKEYLKDNKKKVSIDELEKQLQTATLKAGIASEDFMINNISAYTNYWEKKKDPQFLASKQYTIKVKDLKKLNEIFAGVDARGIAYTNIERYAYSKQDELKKELKIKALKDAKNKALYLTQAIDEQLGGALEISESGSESYPQPIFRTNMLMEMKVADAPAMPDIDFKKIKLSAQVRAVFEIK